MQLKSICSSVAALGLLLGVSVAQAVCVQEGIIRQSTHGQTGPESQYYIQTTGNSSGLPNNTTYYVTVGWGTGGSACDAGAPPGYTEFNNWGLAAQSGHMRVRITGSAATCPTTGANRNMGCFQGAVIY